MKAIILAAGYGTRLGDLTKNTAKPLLSIAGKPILDRIVEKLRRLPQISGIYVVTNDKFNLDVVAWKKNNKKDFQEIKILNDGTKSNDDRLGSIGDINFVVEKEKIDDDILIVGGDNLFEDDLHPFLHFFDINKSSSIMLHDVKSVAFAKNLGIASVNEHNQITSFIEKPENPSSTLASTLIYALKKEHLPFIKRALQEGKADRAGDFIKYLSERQPVFGKLLQGKWFDIGTLESLKNAEQSFTK